MSGCRYEIAFLVSESEARPPDVWVINVGKSPPSGQMVSPFPPKDCPKCVKQTQNSRKGPEEEIQVERR